MEIADVVVLCFDTQSQQQAEFERVAEWVRAYGKPAIAVLNYQEPALAAPREDPGHRKSAIAVRHRASARRQHPGRADLDRVARGAGGSAQLASAP